MSPVPASISAKHLSGDKCMWSIHVALLLQHWMEGGAIHYITSHNMPRTDSADITTGDLLSESTGENCIPGNLGHEPTMGHVPRHLRDLHGSGQLSSAFETAHTC